MIKRIVRQPILWLAARVGGAVNLDKIIVSQSVLHARENRKLTHIETLSDVEFHGFSQWGEDGILNWLIDRIPSIPHTFIEFGVENYQESNTRLLLWLRNWRGLVIDGSKKNIADILRQDVSWRFNLKAICAFIDRDNINNLISSSGITGDIGVLSIDIDGNDYWVWEAIDIVKPAIVVCEYNAVFGDLKAITIPYNPDFYVTNAHYSNLYFGASIPALIELGKKKGYQFVGTNLNGCNAFFVHDDFAENILNAINKVIAYPSHFRSSRNAQGKLTFLNGIERVECIKHLPVVDIINNKTLTLAECGELYSPEWKDIE
jgi:hypothetical protein